MGHREFGILRTGMPCGLVIWDFRTLFNIETVGAQCQENVRKRTLRIKGDYLNLSRTQKYMFYVSVNKDVCFFSVTIL